MPDSRCDERAPHEYKEVHRALEERLHAADSEGRRAELGDRRAGGSLGVPAILNPSAREEQRAAKQRDHSGGCERRGRTAEVVGGGRCKLAGAYGNEGVEEVREAEDAVEGRRGQTEPVGRLTHLSRRRRWGRRARSCLVWARRTIHDSGAEKRSEVAAPEQTRPARRVGQ